MIGRAEAIAYGAATIVNAIALGKGAAFGIGLWTKAEVELIEDKNIIKIKIEDDPEENPLLAEKTVKKVLKYFGVEEYGASVKVKSNIPIARGLKSSSAAANAIALATVGSLNRMVEDLEIVKLGVDAAVEANVTVTGAFDDACASYFGNIVLTDNRSRVIEKRFTLDERLKVLLFIPSLKHYTSDVDVDELKTVSPLIKIAYERAYQGDYWDAMSLNGFIYSTILKQGHQIALEALSSGAIASGLSGKGPSIVAVSREDRVDEVLDAWGHHEGEIKVTEVNREKAHITR